MPGPNSTDHIDPQALIFDFGGVLMRTVDLSYRQALGRELGLSRAQVEAVVFDDPAWLEAEQGQRSLDDFWRHVGRKLGLDDAGLEHFQRQFWGGDQLDRTFVDLIRRLQAAGYATALLSNAPPGLEQRLVALGIADAFDHVVVSGTVGVRKPDAAVFETVLDCLGLPPERALFVDDAPGNVDGARRAGLQAVWFRGLTPLRLRLQELGLPVSLPTRDPLPDLQAVIFDWGGVLERLPGPAQFEEWERRLGLGPGALRQVLRGDAARQLERGVIDEDAFAAHVARRLGMDEAGAAQRFLDAFYGAAELNRGVYAAACALRQRAKTALLTNAHAGLAVSVAARHGLDVTEAFDVVINSADVGLRKPDPAIFRLVLDRLDVAPGQALVIDDSLVNVDAARAIGLNVLQFVNPTVSLHELSHIVGPWLDELDLPFHSPNL